MFSSRIPSFILHLKRKRRFFFLSQALDLPTSNKKICQKIEVGPVRESNPGSLAPKARIMPLDQQAFERLEVNRKELKINGTRTLGNVNTGGHIKNVFFTGSED